MDIAVETPFIRLHPEDTVLIARRAAPEGTAVAPGIVSATRIPPGHKVAIRAHAVGDVIKRYGQIIGFATQPIAPGDWVHVQNCGMGEFTKDYAWGVDAKPTLYVPQPATFMGIVRPDGRVATRNYIGIVTSVNCSAHVASMIADAFKRNPFIGSDPLAEYPNVDGVVALTHKTGCGMGDNEGLRILRRTLAGFARHVNFSHVIAIGLGCEVNQISGLLEEQNLAGRLRNMDIQSMGGTRKTVEAGIAFVREVLEESNKAHRQPVPASHLTVALQCGGSDGYSGITANPALGAASDLLVRHGGTVILSETPETYGAEHLLTRRATSREVGQKLVGSDALVGRIRRARAGGAEQQPLPRQQGRRADHHPGEVARRHGQGRHHQPDRRLRLCRASHRQGLRVHGHAGLRPGGRHGQVAGGANVVCFTTGRGSVFGCKPAPSIKLATNSAMYERMEEDMDVNCGTILSGRESVEECGQRIFELILRVASGEHTKSESFDFGAAEFAPWPIGATM
jgi:altronate hydrolase